MKRFKRWLFRRLLNEFFGEDRPPWHVTRVGVKSWPTGCPSHEEYEHGLVYLTLTTDLDGVGLILTPARALDVGNHLQEAWLAATTGQQYSWIEDHPAVKK